ncbi:MAG: NAD(+) synthase [Lachnospiraceae bacterium]|nr:NAD(+) synthase [Lachnospiraceae bacterium]
MREFRAIEVKYKCVAWIRDFFEKNGKDCNCIIGISGGKDSSVVAALCVEALGKERVIGVLMPNGEQSDIDVAQRLVEFLGITGITINIGPVVQAVTQGVQSALPEGLSSQAVVNLPPRIRMAVLYAVSQSKNGRVANTCNLSEDWVGYSTRYGDSVGDFSPLSELTVTEVKLVGRAAGLPAEFIDKVPTDGLCGKSDEDNLGFSYEVLDRYIRTGEIEDAVVKEKIDRLHEKNLFKLQLMPKFTEEIKG